MIQVVAHWDPPAAWREPFAQQKALGLLTLTCKAFGVERLAIVDVDGVCDGSRDEELDSCVVGTLDEALALFGDDCARVWLEHGGRKLRGFRHPKSAVYIVGSDYGELAPRAGERRVTVETRSTFGLYSHVALGIVLHHRGAQWLS